MWPCTCPLCWDLELSDSPSQRGARAPGHPRPDSVVGLSRCPTQLCSAVARAKDTHRVTQMLSRVLQGASVPGLTALPMGLLDGFSHLAKKLTRDPKHRGLGRAQHPTFSVPQVTAHKNSALAGIHAVTQEDHPAHPCLSFPFLKFLFILS